MKIPSLYYSARIFLAIVIIQQISLSIIITFYRIYGLPILEDNMSDFVSAFLTLFNNVYFPISNSLKSFGALFLTVYICEQQLRLNKRPSKLLMQAVGVTSQAVLSPLLLKQGGGSRNIMSTEIEEKEKEFESEQQHANNHINRAKTKIPNQNRVTTKMPSTINDDEDQEYRMEED